MRNKPPQLKKLPVLRSDRKAERFVATANLTEYDLSAMVPYRFEFKPKTERVNMRLSKDLLDSVKRFAIFQSKRRHRCREIEIVAHQPLRDSGNCERQRVGLVEE